MSKDGDQITNLAPVTSLVPFPKENQDSKNFNDIYDSTGGPVDTNIEKLSILSKDSKDTPLEDDKDFKDAKLESKKETSKATDAPSVESQPGITKSFGVAAITHQTLRVPCPTLLSIEGRLYLLKNRILLRL